MAEKRELIEEFGDEFGFLIKWTYTEAWAEADICEVISICDGSKTYETYGSAYIRYDGRSDFNFGESLQLVDWFFYEKHFALLTHIYQKAMQLMGD